MIIWKGRGILALIIGVAALVLTQVVVDGANGDGYYQAHAWPKLLSGVIGAVPIWLLGKKWNDEAGGGHELFFIPMQYWAFILIALSLWVAVSPSDHRTTPGPTSASAVSEGPTEAPSIPGSREPMREAAPVRTSQPAPASQTATGRPENVATASPEVSRPLITQVYADNQSHHYYPEDCPGRPANSFRIARSVARLQGYTLAPTCSE